MTEQTPAEKPPERRCPCCCHDEDDSIDFTSFWEYVQSEKGHEVVQRIVGMIDDVKKATLAHHGSYAKLDKVLQYVLVIGVVVASAWLSVVDKFSTPVGVMFGTLVGYAFGRRK